MNRLVCLVFLLLILQLAAVVPGIAENGSKETKIGAYLVKEGRVEHVTSRSLVLDGIQYPISIFVRVFSDSEKGAEWPMHTIANTGKIDKARIYILGGKVERIIVLKNI